MCNVIRRRWGRVRSRGGREGSGASTSPEEREALMQQEAKDSGSKHEEEEEGDQQLPDGVQPNKCIFT